MPVCPICRVDDRGPHADLDDCFDALKRSRKAVAAALRAVIERKPKLAAYRSTTVRRKRRRSR